MNAPGSGRTHPPSLFRLVERTVRDERLIVPGDRVVCACSGGPDSTALLHALARLRKKVDFELFAHGVDHGLRPEAADELELAAQLARAVDVPFDMTRVVIPVGANLQARARAARLGALGDAAIRLGAKRIATGHTADDRAETLLLRLLRGAGPRGLAVLPPRADMPKSVSFPAHPGLEGPAPVELIRPLLRARRADVALHIARHGLAVAEDPSNRDSRFSRVRVRHELLPLLEELSPGIVAHLGALADMLAAERWHEDPFAHLGRAQRQAIDRAARLGRSRVRLRLRGGFEQEVVLKDPDRAALCEGDPSRPSARPRRPGIR